MILLAQECIQAFEALSEPPDNISIFSTGCILPGDVLVLPAGVALVEKSVNSHSAGIRLCSHVVHEETKDSLEVAKSILPKMLVCAWTKFFFCASTSKKISW